MPQDYAGRYSSTKTPNLVRIVKGERKTVTTARADANESQQPAFSDEDIADNNRATGNVFKLPSNDAKAMARRNANKANQGYGKGPVFPED